MRRGKLLLTGAILFFLGPSLAGAAQEPKRDPKKEPLVVSITIAGAIWVMTEQVALDQVTDRFKRELQDANEPVYVRGHESLDFSKITRVLSRIKAAGFTNIVFVVAENSDGASRADAKQIQEGAKKKQLDAEKIAALLNKPKPSGTQISASDIARIKNRVYQCIHDKWVSSVGLENSEGLLVTIELHLDEMGRLTLPPRVLHDGKPKDMVYFTMADRAVKAAKECQPFDLPSEQYSVWKKVTMDLEWPRKSP